MLEMEEAIQDASNDLGRCATEEALHRFDTDGSPIQLGAVRWTVRSCDPKEYQTPYGRCELSATSTRLPVVGTSTVRWNTKHG